MWHDFIWVPCFVITGGTDCECSLLKRKSGHDLWDKQIHLVIQLNIISVVICWFSTSNAAIPIMYKSCTVGPHTICDAWNCFNNSNINVWEIWEFLEIINKRGLKGQSGNRCEKFWFHYKFHRTIWFSFSQKNV